MYTAGINMQSYVSPALRRLYKPRIEGDSQKMFLFELNVCKCSAWHYSAK